MTLIPEGEVNLIEVFVAKDGEVVQGSMEEESSGEDSSQLTLADLVIRVGRRVKVLYRLENDRRVAHSIIVDPDQ